MDLELVDLSSAEPQDAAIETSGIATDIRARGERIQQAHDVATTSPPTTKQMPSGS